MTYRFCELACGRGLPVRGGIDWRNVSCVVPVDLNGNEIKGDTEWLWTKQVIETVLDGTVLLCKVEV